MYKDSKWAYEILSQRDALGLWGYFHTLSDPSKVPITTEQALRRLELLGYTMDDEPIEKAVGFMHDCLAGDQIMPDRREKTHDWDIFTELILSTWIRRFTKEDELANGVALRWANMITYSFQSGAYSQKDYMEAYHSEFHQKAQGGRLVDFVSFYPVSLTAGLYDIKTESAVFDHILHHPHGIYYIYHNPLCILPESFASKGGSRYLRAIEMLTEYKHNLDKLQFVSEWIDAHKNSDNQWDMGASVKDHVLFPLSDSWDKEARLRDCTYRMEGLLRRLTAKKEYEL